MLKEIRYYHNEIVAMVGTTIVVAISLGINGIVNVFTIFTFITATTMIAKLLFSAMELQCFFLQCYYVSFIFIILFQFMFDLFFHLTIMFKIILHLCLSISIKWDEFFFNMKLVKCKKHHWSRLAILLARI
jgi:hypothetical protein